MSTIIFSATVPLSPVAKGRPRFGKGFTYTPAKTRQAENALKSILRGSMLGRPPSREALALEVCFYLMRPKSVKRVHPSVRPDLDNYIKALMDAGNGIVWEDDCQIVDIRAVKRYGSPRIQILVTLAY